MKRAASITLIVCLVIHAIPVRAQERTVSGPPPVSTSQVAPRTAWRVPARLVARTGGGHLEEPKGLLVSDPVARQLRFEADHRDVFDVAYDRIIGVHYEDGAKHPERLFNKQVEFYLTIRYSDKAVEQRASTVRLDKDDVPSTLDGLEADTGLTIDRTAARQSFLGLPIRVAVGDRVSVTDVTGRRLKGRLTELSDSSLAVNGSGSAARVFDEASVAKIRLRYSPGHAALLGFGTGAAVGGGFGVLACASFECDGGELLAVVGLAGGIIGVWGAGLGVVLGAVIHPLRKSNDVSDARARRRGRRRRP